MAKVHASCLEQWLNRRELPVGDKPCCEVCKAPYKMRMSREIVFNRATLCSKQSCSFYMEFGVVLLCLCSLIYIFILSTTSVDDNASSLTWDVKNPVFVFTLTAGTAVAGFSLFTLWKMCRQWREQIANTVMVFHEHDIA